MDTKFDFGPNEEDRMVYVRRVDVADLPEDVQEEVQDEVDGAEKLYAVHNSEGERLALVKDRQMAFILARQNDFAPVSVH